jgi:imidazolonepropionase-like amidohydrolase
MKYILKNCTVFDGMPDSTEKEHADIYVSGENIEKITYGESESPEKGYKIIDCSGKFVSPGLINMHAHLFGTGKPAKFLGGGVSQKAMMKIVSTYAGLTYLRNTALSAVKNELYGGCTTVRSVGDFRFADVYARNKVKAGLAQGPRLIVSGPAITAENGHGDGTFAKTAYSAKEAEQFVEINAEHNVDFIKICITGGVMDAKVKGEPGMLRMDPQIAAAICKKAHEMGFKVASHTESEEGIDVAVRSGVDTIEHGSPLNDDRIKGIKANGSALICTFSPAIPLSALPPELTRLDELCVYNSAVLTNKMISGVRTALENEIPVGLGTDASCPFVAQYAMWREICWFQMYTGVSNAFALSSATYGNAKILGINNITGSLSAGKCADMIITAEDPLKDLSVLRDLDTVIAAGKIYDKPVPDRIEHIDTNVDTLMHVINFNDFITE